ncbi:hypothetical protein GRW89_11280 [Pseudomonas moraviensis]|uniref:hypothetical protein n=1 Tax=Pseudomonas moraviensis TaxID=321662 RepID=UPI00135D3949|nr:hypothetical protein [Pseudomonas moraviensis]MXI47087.1 hypothetical protein [Pseudomonas moraviensis]
MLHSNVVSKTASRLAKAGAIAYIIWALLHFEAAWSVYQLGQSMAEGLPRARVFQDAWHLLCLSGIAFLVAIFMNWRNDARGWLINLVIVSVVDLGFIFYVLLPGYVAMWPGLAGPLTWTLGLFLSTLALRYAARRT